MAPVRPVTSTTTSPPTTSSSTMTTTTTPETMMPSTSSTAGSVSDIDPRIVNRPQDADSTNPDDGFVFPEETTEPPTDAGDPSLGGGDPSLRRSPLPLSPCLPLDQLDCGLLASPGLTQGLLEFVESGNVRTDQVNSFLDKALELAVSSLGPVQVQVDPADLQMEGGGPDGKLLVGDGGCTDNVVLTRWNGQVANMGRGSLGGQGGLQVNGWLQGQVQARG